MQQPTAKPTNRKEKPNLRLKQGVDWEAIRRDYATTALTSRELAAKYQHIVSHSTITRRAEKEGWKRDLAEPIKRATDAALIHAAVAQAIGAELPKQSDVVLAAAELNKQVILSHRTELQQTRTVAKALLQELAGSALLAEHMDILAAILAGKDPEPGSEAQARIAVQKALGITSRIGGIKGLTEALTKLHAAERIAFNLDAGEDKPAGAMSELLDRIKRSALPVQLAPAAEEGDDE